MRCPRCSTSTLDERVREGVTIDVCADCRGVWLDRGELEKLIARERQDYDDYSRDYDRYRAQPHPKGRYGSHERPHGYKRPKTFLESLGDLFD